MSRKVLDVFVSFVDYFRQFLPVDNFLVNVHSDAIDEFTLFLRIRADYLCDSRAPIKSL